MGQKVYWTLTQALFPHLYPRWDPIFQESLSLGWLRENYSAWRRFHKFDQRNVKQCLIFCYPRGGSHVFPSQLHFMRNVFVFGDAFSLPLSNRSGQSYRSFLLRSIFKSDGLQSKNADDITHIFYMLNGWNQYSYPEFNTEQNDDYFRIFYLRNPIRILASMQAKADVGKVTWAVTDEFFVNYLQQFKQSLARMLNYVDSPRTMVMFHAVFCIRPEESLKDVCRLVGIPLGELERRASPAQFFERSFGTSRSPIEKEGRLLAANSGREIVGTGAFRPLSRVDPERAFAHDLTRIVSPRRREILNKIFGRRLTNLWTTDSPSVYRATSNEEILKLIRKSMPLHAAA